MLINRQRGAVLIEFALSFLVFWIVFIGIVEFGRAMLAWNAAAEATRLAARVASICTSANKSAVTNKSLNLLQLTGQVHYVYEADENGDGINEQIKIDMSHDIRVYDSATNWLQLDYFPVGCTNSNCEQVQASLSNLHIILRLPGWNLDIPLPANRTTILREGMSNLNRFNSGAQNPYCI
jgi:uncharacterized protein (UPF0333 family)